MKKPIVKNTIVSIISLTMILLLGYGVYYLQKFYTANIETQIPATQKVS